VGGTKVTIPDLGNPIPGGLERDGLNFVLRNLQLPYAGVRKEIWEGLAHILAFLESHGWKDIETTFSEIPD